MPLICQGIQLGSELYWCGCVCCLAPSGNNLSPWYFLAVAASPPSFVQNGSKVFAMRHARRVKKLGRPADQRKALMRGLVTEVLRHGKITTTKVSAYNSFEAWRLLAQVFLTALWDCVCSCLDCNVRCCFWTPYVS